MGLKVFNQRERERNTMNFFSNFESISIIAYVLLPN
jgi:hypothetical protein